MILSSKFHPGQIIIVSLIFLAAAAILSSTLFGRTARFLRFGGNSLRAQQAQGLAEAGVDYAIWKLNESAGSYSGDNQTLSTGSFTVTITNKSASLKTITSTGYVPDTTSPRAKRTIKVDTVVNSTEIAFRYAVQVGSGGVLMAQSATINGSVYSNAVDGVNKSIQGANSARINGDAYAVGTITQLPNLVVTGTRNENQPPSEMPTFDYQYWKDQASCNDNPSCITTCTPDCEINGGFASIGPRKYVGNLIIGNQAIVTVDGPIWVTGNVFITQGGTQVNLNPNFGSSGTTLIADGTVTVSQGAAFNPTNANPKGYLLVVTTSTNQTSAMSISNQGANAVFYALEGGAQLTQTASVSGMVAKSLSMSNNSVLNYDIGLAGAQFSQGPGGSWQIKKGTYRFTGNP